MVIIGTEEIDVRTKIKKAESEQFCQAKTK